MLRIKIKELPHDRKISKEELRKIVGGTFCVLPLPTFYPLPRAAVRMYHSTLEGAGHREDMQGLKADQQDYAKDKWSDSSDE